MKLTFSQCLTRANERIKGLAEDHMVIIDTHDRQTLAIKVNAMRDQVFPGAQVSDNVRTFASEVSDRQVQLQYVPLTSLCHSQGACLFQQ